MQSKRAKTRQGDLQSLEALEVREVLTAPTLTAYEQLLLELINRSRANPTAEAAMHGVGLNDGVDAQDTISTNPKQPLAPNEMLLEAATLHSLDMLANDYFAHSNLQGQTPIQRANAQGYPSQFVGENLSWGGSTGPIDNEQHVYDRHMRLFQSSGHRVNMLLNDYKEVGASIEYGVFTDGTPATNYNASMVTQKFGRDFSVTTSFITGVAFTDATTGADDNNFYDIGEGVTGTIRIVNTQTLQEYTDGIGAAGGYAVAVPDGTYNVYATINGVDYQVTGVVISGENEKVDFETTTAQIAVSGELIYAQNESTGQWTTLVPSGSQFNANVTTGWNSSVTWVHQNVGDFNGDTYTDVIAMNQANGQWFVSTGNADGTLNAPTLWMTYNADSNFNTPWVGDFNGDGSDDLLFRYLPNGGLYARYSNGSSAFGSSTGSAFLNPNITWEKFEVADFNGDGKDDLISRETSSGRWWINYAKTSGVGFENISYVAFWNTTLNWDQFKVADFNGDGFADLMGRRTNTGQLYVNLNTGNASGARFGGYTVWGTLGTSVFLDIETGDFNGDGKWDVVARQQSTGKVFVYLANSAGTAFDAPTSWNTLSTSINWVDAQFADFNGDGNDDMAIRIAANGAWYVALSNGTTTFVNSPSPWFTWNPADTWSFVSNGYTYPQMSMTTQNAVVFAGDETELPPVEASLFDTASEDDVLAAPQPNSESFVFSNASEMDKSNDNDSSLWNAFENIGELLS